MWTEKCEKNEVGKMRVRRRDNRIRFFALGVFAAVFLFTFLVQSFKKLDEEVGAASLANFDPGYIISDYQMGNYASMSEAEIQAFLTAKNSCKNTNYNDYLLLSSNNNYTWHWENGHFVCLSEERFGDGEVIGSGDTAAHIIWQAAQDYKINPQVLLVLLQKETGLITDPIPNNGDYRKAAGYGCPDTAPCSSQYYGFKNQVRKAAALYRTVLDGGWTNYPLGENYVQYNPNPDCGGSVVNIRSLATSALYRYTPYQPNAGALAAGYGTAYCGAYGNRNFYLYFEDWFGGITNGNSELEQIIIERGLEEIIGNNISEERSGLKDGASYQLFENAVVYKHPIFGTHAVMTGEIRDLYRSYGLESGKLGYPISEERDGYQTFENDYIVGNGRVFVSNILDEYQKNTNLFGEALSDSMCGIRDGGCYQVFSNGIVYFSKMGVYIVEYGCILDKFRLAGRENGIGYPTSYRINGLQLFENGKISEIKD